MTILDSLSIDSNNDIYFNPLFQQCIETFLPTLKTDPRNTTLVVEPTDAYRFEGDLRGLLLSKKIKPEHVWIMARVNGYKSYSEYDGKIINFTIPATETIKMIIQRFNTANRNL